MSRTLLRFGEVECKICGTRDVTYSRMRGAIYAVCFYGHETFMCPLQRECEHHNAELVERKMVNTDSGLSHVRCADCGHTWTVAHHGRSHELIEGDINERFAQRILSI
jgi:ribosomal protein S27E